MEIYSTEEQQVEAIKQWWKDNGKAVLIGAIIGLGSLFGWRYYQGETLAKQESASFAYSQTVNALNSGQADAVTQAEEFAAQQTNAYSSLLSLQLAKTLVEANSLDEAAAQLRYVQLNSDADDALFSLATVRLARIEIQLGQFDAALLELNKVTASSWQAQVEALKGDVYVRIGDNEKAAVAYAASISESQNPVIQMKLDNLTL